MSHPIKCALPEGFLWGAATAAHQVEGNNVNSDCWLCENVTPTVFSVPSRDACDSYNRYEEDIEITSSLGLNCHRFGIEWARIEPEPGLFSTAELDRYRRMLEACHSRGLRPMVTLNHFTVPRWFAAKGGFEHQDSADLFARFAQTAGNRLGDLIDTAATFNEANMQRLLAQLLEHRPEAYLAINAMRKAAAIACGSDTFSPLLFAPVETTEANMVAAHQKAMEALRTGPGDYQIGLTLTMQDVQPVGEDSRAEEVIEGMYGPWLEAARASDFVGVQTYTRVRVDAHGRMPPPEGAELTGMGDEFYPRALGGTVRFAHERIGRPIIVTENGLATDDDTRRIAYIDGALDSLSECLSVGIDVRGYISWSLLDNFEWTRGYGPRFGLVHVDFDTFERTIKPSGYHFGQIARA